MELSSEKLLSCFIHAHVEWLLSICAIGRDHDSAKVVFFQELVESIRHLTSEVVKDHKCRVVMWEFQKFLLVGNVRNQDLLLHRLSIYPVVMAECDVPILWKLDSWKTPSCFTLVNELRGKEITRERASKYCYDLPFVIYCGDFNSFPSFFLHRP